MNSTISGLCYFYLFIFLISFNPPLKPLKKSNDLEGVGKLSTALPATVRKNSLAGSVCQHHSRPTEEDPGARCTLAACELPRPVSWSSGLGAGQPGSRATSP